MKYIFSEFNKMPYMVAYPENYEKGKKYPIIILINGAGTRGTDPAILKDGVYYEYAESCPDFPFVTVSPLCYKNTWFDLFETLEAFVCMTSEMEFTDKERIYLMGTSMGGYAAWQLAMSMPEYFAAIVPVCGGGMYWNAGRLVNVPVWAFHGKLDPVVFVEESEKMVNAVNKNGGNAKLTIYPEIEHAAWTPTYKNPEVYSWLLSHKNENASEIKNKYTDSKLYG